MSLRAHTLTGVRSIGPQKDRTAKGMQYTEVELAVADKLGLEPELVKKVLDTFETEFDRLEQEQYDQWVTDKTI